MKAVKSVMVMTAVWLALLAGIAAAQKNIAVVETEVDAQSGASAQMNPADVRLVTAELRREAVKNLPRDRYNIMTTETVYAQGSAVLEECADENCVITLGSKIGADYIVRGTMSKVLTKLSLSVEIYETENGNLVASSDPVRSESIGELLEKAAAVCAEMYQTFASRHGGPAPKPEEPRQPATYIVTVNVNPPNGGIVARSPNKVYYDAGEYLGLWAEENDGYTFTGWTGAASGGEQDLAIKVDGHLTLTANFRQTRPDPTPEYRTKPEPPPKQKFPVSLGAGGLIANDFGGGLVWGNGEQVTTPNLGLGVYLFFDIKYAEIIAGYSGRNGAWKSPDAKISDKMPEWDIRYTNLGLFTKYPICVDSGCVFPLLGVDYEASRGTKDFNAAWVKLGIGYDGITSDKSYLRIEVLYGWRTETEMERVMRDMESNYSAYDVKTKPGDGFTFKLGIGIKL